MNSKINPKLEEGDRVVLIVMSDPYSPVTVGTKGTVIGKGSDPWSKEPLYYVEWDNGRTLNLVGDEDVWVKDENGEMLSEQTVKVKHPCDTLTQGRTFCKNLNKILTTGTGGTGSRKLKNSSINFFRDLLNSDLQDIATSITLKPGDANFVERYDDLINFHELLKKYNVCSKMRKSIENDLKVVGEKGLKMLVDNDEQYSLFNRLDTHYSNQSYILTKALLDLFENEDIDSFKNKDIIEKVNLFFDEHDEEAHSFILSTIQNIIDDENDRETLMGYFDFTRSRGNEVEKEAAEALRKNGYEVYEFGGDFGFVDHFGVDMVAIKNGVLHPIQVSSGRKINPKFYNYQDIDCDCWALYKSGKQFRRETMLNETKEGLINVLRSNDIDPSEMQDLLTQLSDEQVSDLTVRNLERKFLKSGSPRTNAREYLEKLVNSVKNRENTSFEDDDYNVEDELVYGGEEPEKSAIGKKAFRKELLPLQVELLKLQEHIKESGKSIAVVFEGRDTAGKGSTIRTITKYLDPKYFNVVALGIPTPEERKDWFGRYEKYIEPGKITFFDRSWYNRGIVEPVMGYGEEGEYEEFMNTVNDFEKSLVSKGVDLYKFWLSITPKTQEKRFDLRKSSPLKYWKFSPNDEKSLEKWDDYTDYKEKVFDLAKGEVPWTVVDTNDKRIGSLNLLRHILKNSDYPDKNEGTIGDTYPESITTINESFIDDMKPLLPILKADNGNHVFNFLIALRDSGIVNMMQSPDFTWSGRDFLDKYLKIQELQDSYQQIEDEDEKENLLQLAEKSQQVMIAAAFRNLQDKEQELSTNNINRELRKLGPLALRYFMMKL